VVRSAELDAWIADLEALPRKSAAWAELSDSKPGPTEPSLAIVDGLHQRWVMLLRSMSDDDFKRQ